MTLFSRLLSALVLLAALAAPAWAQSELGSLIDALAAGKLKQRGAQIEAIAATGDARAVPALGRVDELTQVKGLGFRN